MNDYDKVMFGLLLIGIIIIFISNCCDTHPTVLPPETIQQTPQPQQDIETGQNRKVLLMFKDIKAEEEEKEEEGAAKSSCPICLEEYEDNHEIRRLTKCRHVFHRFCIDSWLTRDLSCPNCRRSVDFDEFIRSERKRCVRMVGFDEVYFWIMLIAIIIMLIAIIIMLIAGCCDCFTRTRLPPETTQQTPQPQQDIETGQSKVLMFKDIKEEEEEGVGKSFCPICLEEYEDDHEIRRLKKCRHVFHRFCIDSWLTRDLSCPSCRRSVDLMSLGL